MKPIRSTTSGGRFSRLDREAGATNSGGGRPSDLLSQQQFIVFELLGDGATNKEIANLLGLHESTVKSHVSAILEKLDCSNRTKVALLALRFRLTGEFRSAAASVDAATTSIEHGRS